MIAFERTGVDVGPLGSLHSLVPRPAIIAHNLHSLPAGHQCVDCVEQSMVPASIDPSLQKDK